jgi:hypothetical protein
MASMVTMSVAMLLLLIGVVMTSAAHIDCRANATIQIKDDPTDTFGMLVQLLFQ